ncbi:MAG: DNA topoisomerase IB [Planctomycetaceae bacterium]
MDTSQRIDQLHRRRAKKVKLFYVNDFDGGIQRRAAGRGFTYVTATGKPVRGARIRSRIDALVIPPAWQDVWICTKANGHIQAIGRDEAGRKQYLYHPLWHAISTTTKYDRMRCFGRLLPRIRRRVRKDLDGRKLSKERVLAAVVRLLDKACVRIGNERYVKERGSRGATTLTADHVSVNGFAITLDFPGKSQKQQEIEFSDRKTAKVIRQCAEIAEQYLFCYRDEQGVFQSVKSTHVNEYLRSISGEAISAKDFRTWWGSIAALEDLVATGPMETVRDRKRAVAHSVKAAAQTLGNTIAVCRKSYIHPGILDAAESGALPSLVAKAEQAARPVAELSRSEVLMMQLLPMLKTAPAAAKSAA